MRIAYISPILAFRDADNLYIQHAAGRIVEKLYEHYPDMVLAFPFRDARSDLDAHTISLKGRRCHALPSMPSFAEGLKKGYAVRRAIRRIEDEVDVCLIQMPFSAATALLAPKTPRLYHICADVRGVVGASKYYQGLKRFAAQSAAWGVQKIQEIIIARDDARLITNGAEMFEQYFPRHASPGSTKGQTRGQPVLSSVLRECEVASVQRQRGHGGPFRLLFVGYLRPEKGIDVLFDALQDPRLDRHDLEIVIVGCQDAVEGGAAEDLQAQLCELQSKVPVRFKGALDFGPALFQEFANADALVLPSRSEGTPRVLVEARAFGCPVIASRVGGVPFSVEDGVDGLLVEPGSPDLLSEAIDGLISKPGLREALVSEGLKRALGRTLESYVQVMVDELDALRKHI